MLIEIENTSSPGASFTDNTNNVLLEINDWIKQNENVVMPFKEFRMVLQREKGINDNNSRNIYPLLKNGGLIQYENRGSLAIRNFFTKTGRAYVTALDAKQLLSNSEQYTDEQKRIAAQKFDTIISEIIREALSKILKHKKLNYVNPFKEFMAYILKYNKINKTEFAYFLYERKYGDVAATLKSIEQNVLDYRDGSLEFDIKVNVRNDTSLREKTNSEKRKEGLSFLTSYTYFSSLILQADIVTKKDGYFILKEERRSELIKLLEV